MNRPKIRIPATEEGRYTFLAISILILVAAAMLLCRSLLDKMLRVDAQNTSTNWAAMLVSRNPDIVPWLAGIPPSEHTREIIGEASQVGDVYRFRIWDTNGHLLASSERIPSSNLPTNAEPPIAGVIRSGSIWNEVHAGNAPNDVPYFVESLIPIKQNGAVIGVFDVYLDQSDDKDLYEKSILLSEGVIGLLALLAAGIPGYFVYRQMIEQRTAKAEAIYMSEHDSLTGIPNRKRLSDLARGALAANRRNRSHVAVLMIDLNGFKEINDTYGHPAGDEVLKTVAWRLRSSIRAEDSLARFGGDEFVVLQIGVAQPNGVAVLAERLIESLSLPFEINGAQLSCGACVGVAVSPPDGDTFDTLLARADVALYKSKAQGHNSITFFEPGMDAAVRERRQLETDIRRALATSSFQLAYQPIYCFHDASLLGFEALLRWPEGWSPQSPAAFIPVAEESGLINPIGAWVLETACKAAAGWASPLRISVNLSPVQFRQGNIVSVIENALEISGLDPARLELEVTESLWIQNTDTVLDQLTRLRRLGISIALDDFGTGYSSLSYLWKFPFEKVKIDRSFVGGMESEPKAAAIINTIVSLGKTLGLTVTAEGVETPIQAQILKEAGCDQAQGYLFGRPLSVAAANALANAELVPAKEDDLATLAHHA